MKRSFVMTGNPSKKIRTQAKLLVCLATGALASWSGMASAEVASARGYALKADISILGGSTLHVDPLAVSEFTDATEAADETASLPSIDLGDNLLVNLTTGLVTSEAEYLPGATLQVGAQSTVADLSVSLVGLLGDALLEISADLIQSRVGISGYCVAPVPPAPRELFGNVVFQNGFDQPNLIPDFGGPDDGGGSGGGDVDLIDLVISVLGNPVLIPVDFDPNTTIDLGIATIIINEQTITGDLVNMASVEQNALHVSLDVIGVVTADIIAGHSEASVDCTR
jgi:hypothetical protein